MNEIISIAVLLLLLWYWWDSMQAKEHARQAGRFACEKADLQFLDDTVAKQYTRLKRNPRGHMSLYRKFIFEFTSQGDERYTGFILMEGKNILDLEMDVHKLPD